MYNYGKEIEFVSNFKTQRNDLRKFQKWDKELSKFVQINVIVEQHLRQSFYHLILSFFLFFNLYGLHTSNVHRLNSYFLLSFQHHLRQICSVELNFLVKLPLMSAKKKQPITWGMMNFWVCAKGCEPLVDKIWYHLTNWKAAINSYLLISFRISKLLIGQILYLFWTKY